MLLSPGRELLQAECYVVIEMLTRDSSADAPCIFSKEACASIRKTVFDPLRCLYTRKDQPGPRKPRGKRKIAPSIIRSRRIIYTEFSNNVHIGRYEEQEEKFLDWYTSATRNLERMVHETIEKCGVSITPEASAAISTAIDRARKRELELI